MKPNRKEGQDYKTTYKGGKNLLTIFRNVLSQVLGSKIPGCPNSEKALIADFDSSSFFNFHLLPFIVNISFNLHVCANDFQIVIFNYELFPISNSLQVISLWLSHHYPLKHNLKSNLICCLLFPRDFQT